MEVIHQCTDKPCCLLFLLAFLAWICCYLYGGVEGNADRLFRGLQVHGVDSPVICGLDETGEDKPYSYWCVNADILAAESVGTCKGAMTEESIKAFIWAVCVPTCSISDVPPECRLYSGNQSFMPYMSFEFLGRFCLPNATDSSFWKCHLNDIAGKAFSGRSAFAAEFIVSIINGKWVLLVAFSISVALGFMYLVSLKCCAVALIWGSMIVSVLGFLALGLYLFLSADDSLDKVTTLANANVPGSIVGNVSASAKVFSVVCFVVSFVLLCLILCFCSSIKTSARVVEVACETMWAMPIVLVVPLMQAIVKGIVLLAICYGSALLFTTSPPTGAGDITLYHTASHISVLLYFLFASFWILALLDALYQFIVAYLVADYYYTPYVEDEKNANQMLSFFQSLRHGLVTHGGSLAFGSLLIAITQFIQALLKWAERKSQDTAKSKVISCIIAIFLCCFKCCEQHIEVINKSAYIDLVVGGTDDFCEATKNALSVVIHEFGSLANLQGATLAFSAFGTCIITLVTMAIGYGIVLTGNFDDFVGSGSFHAIPNKVAVLIMAGIVSFLVSLCFVNVLDMTSETLLYCYGFDNMMRRSVDTAPPRLRDLIDGDKSEEQT